MPDPTVIVHVTSNNDWLAGGFGVTGVIVGGLITAGVEASKARRSERAQARAGARLLRRQLMSVASSVATAARKGTWGPTRGFETPAWDEYGAAFALSLSPDEWSVVSNAIVNIRRTGQVTIDLHAPGWKTEVVSLSDEVVAVLRPIYEDCRSAFAALHRVARVPQADQELPMVEAVGNS